MTYVMLVLSLVLLVVGANWLVDGSAAIARRYHISEYIIGATIVGMGTSTPELVVSLISGIEGHSDIAIGNVVGSNIFNLIILSVSDVLYTGTGLYDFSDPKTVALLAFGFLAHPLILCALKLRSRWIQVGMSVGAVASYVGFLTI